MSQAEALIRDLPAGHVIADKGYASSALVATIVASGAAAVIPPRSNRREPRDDDTHMYRERNQMERLCGRLKECRRLATRSEKSARNDLAFCQLASIVVPPWPDCQ